MKTSRIEKNAPFQTLRGESITEYVDMLSCCISAIRLNDLYPSFERILHSVDLMDPEINRGLYTALKLHPESGLPAYSEFVRVQSDWEIAPSELCALVDNTQRAGNDIYHKLARRKAYLTEIQKHAPFVEHTSVRFRKIDVQDNAALFRVVLDRIGPQGSLERTTVECIQKNQVWSREGISLCNNDVAAIKDDLKGLIYRLSPLDASLMYCRLSETEGLAVTKIVKGSVGPFVSSAFRPHRLKSALKSIAGNGAVLTAAIQIAEIERDGDHCNDPLSNGMALSIEARNQFCEEKGIPVFHMYYDRKFALLNGEAATLNGLMQTAKTRNIVYQTQ